MCYQDNERESERAADADLEKLVAALDDILAALDAAGEGIAAAHVDMARNVLLSRKPKQEKDTP